MIAASKSPARFCHYDGSPARSGSRQRFFYTAPHPFGSGDTSREQPTEFSYLKTREDHITIHRITARTARLHGPTSYTGLSRQQQHPCPTSTSRIQYLCSTRQATNINWTTASFPKQSYSSIPPSLSAQYLKQPIPRTTPPYHSLLSK